MSYAWPRTIIDTGGHAMADGRRTDSGKAAEADEVLRDKMGWDGLVVSIRSGRAGGWKCPDFRRTW